MSIFLFAFGFIKDFFSSSGPEARTNRLTFFLILGLVLFLSFLLVLSHVKSNKIHKLTAQNAVAQQAVQNAVQTNQNLAATVAQQQQTTTDSIAVVDQQNSYVQTQIQHVQKVISHKDTLIRAIHKKAQTQLKLKTTPVQASAIKTEEQNQVSQIQINSIWQAYCSAAGLKQCPSTSS